MYFWDATGGRWRVYDLTFGPPHNPPFRFTKYRPPHAEATYRAFVDERGERYYYKFERAEDRRVDLDTLVMQQRNAEYVAKERFNPATHYTPGER